MPDEPISEEEIQEYYQAEASLDGKSVDPDIVRLKNLSLNELMELNSDQAQANIDAMKQAAATAPNAPHVSTEGGLDGGGPSGGGGSGGGGGGGGGGDPFDDGHNKNDSDFDVTE